MKTIYLNRHAKSSWSDYTLKDFDRPLNARGKRDAPDMADRFLSKEKQVDLIVSSTAKRALATARVFADKLNTPIQEEKDIYESRIEDVLSIVNALDDQHDSVLLFGHNPCFSSMIDYLCDQSIYMPTCGIVKITFEFDSWKLISAGTGTFVYFDFPKNK